MLALKLGISQRCRKVRFLLGRYEIFRCANLVGRGSVAENNSDGRNTDNNPEGDDAQGVTGF